MAAKMDAEKKRLIEGLKIEGFLKTKLVERAMKSVPREKFVLPRESKYAYADVPQGIGFGQTISAPHMVAMMTELLEPKRKDKVLEVGGGSGYQAAVLAKLVKKVYSIELEQKLVDFAIANLKQARIRNVEVRHGDGSKGWPEHAPYDKIIMTCACTEVPKPLFRQLKPGGLLVAPVGGGWLQDLKLFKKSKTNTKQGKGKTRIEEKSYGGCVFVPLRH
jgi:protein-L-isoaspartate(D-aspartate) O-methyltransferase